jgi:hypothetical protein
VFALVCVSFVALAVAGVGDVGVDLPRFEALDVGVAVVAGVARLVLFDHTRDGGFDLRGFALEVGAAAALGLGGVAGELHAVDGEHVAADETLAVAHHEHLGEDTGDGLAVIGNEGGNGAVVRLAVTAQRDEDDVVPAGGLDAARADDAAAVGEEHDLEQHAGVVRGGAGQVVPEHRGERREVEFVIDEHVQRMLEGAGKDLLGEVHGDELGLHIDVPVARHLDHPCSNEVAQMMPSAMPRGKGREGVFLQPQRSR